MAKHTVGKTKYKLSVNLPKLKNNEFVYAETALFVAKDEGKKVERFTVLAPNSKGMVFEITLYRVV